MLMKRMDKNDADMKALMDKNTALTDRIINCLNKRKPDRKSKGSESPKLKKRTRRSKDDSLREEVNKK